ncbi:MAG: ribonuclease HI [Candidatus Carbobacillus altaicus]|nr:ribonuclease HI [Candidatus Carbobacillus altaicus]
MTEGREQAVEAETTAAGATLTTEGAEEEVVLYTDGACSGNPGPGGWAAILRYKGREKVLTGAEEQTTNNRMELMAVWQGLQSLKRPAKVRVYSDSAYVVNAFEQGWIERWQQNGWRTARGTDVENRDLWEAILEEWKRHEVTFIKVRGHADDDLNNRADMLAVTAMKRVKS